MQKPSRTTKQPVPTPTELDAVDVDVNPLIRGLAWMLAGKAIKKAKEAANRAQ